VEKTKTRSVLLHINVGTGKDSTIKEMAETMKQVIGCVQSVLNGKS